MEEEGQQDGALAMTTVFTAVAGKDSRWGNEGDGGRLERGGGQILMILV